MSIIKLIPTRLLFTFESRLLSNYTSTLKFLSKNNTKIINEIADKKVIWAYKRALKTPAYIKFLKKNKIETNKFSLDFIKNSIPITNKKNYIKQYSFEDRCYEGKLPISGNIDESAGSNGHPTNWIRSVKEEKLLLAALTFEYKYTYKTNKQNIVLSAWSSGPWATGVKYCELVENFTLVKNTSTNVETIIETMKTFGKKYRYIISGYPIFLEGLFNEKFPWKEYDIDIVTGGDSYSTQWPNRIKKHIKKTSKIVSTYGCSDIDIGIGFETDFSKAIRVEMSKNEKLRKKICHELRTIPMMFQFNPLMHHIQNTSNNSFVVTHLEQNSASPKIKYDIEDVGQKLDYNEIISILEKYAPKIIKKYQNNSLKLPFLWISGRKDGTISLDGANIFPEQIDIILSNKFESKIELFKILKLNNKNSIFNIEVELKKNIKISNKLKIAIEKEILEKLPKLNKDYKESLENNKQLNPNVILYKHNEGPFNKVENSIKYSYIDKK